MKWLHIKAGHGEQVFLYDGGAEDVFSLTWNVRLLRPIKKERDKGKKNVGISSSSTASAMTPPGGNKSSPVDDRLLTADRSRSRMQ